MNAFDVKLNTRANRGNKKNFGKNNDTLKLFLSLPSSPRTKNKLKQNLHSNNNELKINLFSIHYFSSSILLLIDHRLLLLFSGYLTLK